jgi:carbon storage regulator
MLVLTRKIGERIYIGNDIYITLLGIDRNRIHIGIVAPPEFTILREELLYPPTRYKDNDNAPSTDSPTTSPNRAQDERRRDERS